MEGTYNIDCGGKKVGTAVISREGLYYRFDCNCQLERKEVCKICVVCGDKRIVLGTPIPEGQIFQLRTKLPVKRFSIGKPRFYIAGSKEEISEEFISVQPNAPFLHLKELKNAVFQVRDGESGIVIRK
ncbi:MAG: hypothetical protein IJZ15_05665 [Oscillospiraceae bacterium]|nr:hypothetical protein [Oscillospiraceae bacterium]